MAITLVGPVTGAVLTAGWLVSSSRDGVALLKTVFQLKQIERTAIFSVTA
jgi:hypothetical protein